jgi:peptide/nickel transport system substrate-binding protein
MRKLLLTCISLLTVVTLLAACGPAATEAPPEEAPEEVPEEAPPEVLKAGQVTDMGGIDDKSFNQTAWHGLEMAEEQLGVEVAYLESQQQTDYAVNITQFLDQDYDLIVTVGFLLGEDTATFAQQNPDTNFAIVDFGYDPVIPNVLGLTFATDEAAFLAGYLAAGMSQTGKIGTFGGIEIPTVTIFMVGLQAGVDYYNEVHGTDVEVLGMDLFVGNFESTDDGRRVAEDLIAEGADIIMPVAGPVGLGTAAAIQENPGTMLIGVDVDWCVSAPEYCDVTLTSVLKNMDVAVLEAVKRVQEGTFEGGFYVGTLANDGVGIADFHEFDSQVSDEMRAELAQIRQGIAEGSIPTGWGVAAPPPEEEAPAEGMSYSAESCDYGGEFLSIEAVDDLTVKFTLCVPDPAFPSKIAFSAFPINDTEYLESTGGGGDIVDNPVGTGPYMLDTWNRGSELVLTRFDDYWGEPAKTETLIFRWNAEAAARLVELQAGTIDGMDNPGSDDFAVIETDPNLALYERAGTNVFYLGMNNWYEPFDNERVRQAFAMAIDKQRIVDNFYPRGSLAASQFMPPVIFGYTPEVEWWEYNPDMAKQILEEEGLLPGFKTTITYRDVVRSYLPEPGVVAQDIQAQLAAIGVELEIVVMESGAFIDASDLGEIDGFHMLGWGADYPDATNFLDFHFGKGATDQFGDGFEDIWDALERGAALADPDERYPIYIEANEAIKQHVPMIPIAHGGSGTAYQADVEGAHASPLGNEYFAVMTPGDRDQLVWMQNAEPIGLYCPDETDGESLRACEQIHEPLLAYEVGGAAVVPSLATSCDASADLTEWTCHLREGVTFHNGATLDADDVVLSYVVQWDVTHPLHVGRDGGFSYFPGLFGGFLNAE